VFFGASLPENDLSKIHNKDFVRGGFGDKILKSLARRGENSGWKFKFEGFCWSFRL